MLKITILINISKFKLYFKNTRFETIYCFVNFKIIEIYFYELIIMKIFKTIEYFKA